MSETKFTPGPWCRNIYDYTITGRGGGYAKISETPEGYEPNGWNDICHMKPKFDYIKRDYALDNSEANGRLICAAPDLYEALKAMRFAYENKDGEHPHEFETQALEMYESAMKKVIGEEKTQSALWELFFNNNEISGDTL